MHTSYKVSDTLYLVRQTLQKGTPAKPVEVPTNHIAVIDCSGSMSGDLPRIREQLKAKLPKILRETDTISLVWFSGRGEYGTLLKAEPVATLKDLKTVEQTIDRWLRPVGMTGFKEPFEEVTRLVADVAKQKPGSAFSLFFMSDGHDNCSSKLDILKAVEKAAGVVSSATFVEYGYYADRPLLTQMVEKAGGTLIFAQDFDQYAPSFEAALQKRGSGAPRVEVKVYGDPVAGFAWTTEGTDLVTFAVENGKIAVPASTSEVWYLSPSMVAPGGPAGLVDLNPHFSDALAQSYAALSLYAGRMKSDVVLALLRANGDVAFIEQFSGLFGKQKYSEFQANAKAASFDSKLRLTKGYDPKRIPRDDAFTALDLLRILSQDDENKLLLDHPMFKYSAIGRARVDANESLTQDELDEIAKLTAQLASEKSVKKIQDLNARIAAVTAGKQALKFEADPAPDGYSISNLTYNEDRPNVSVLVRKSGTVDLSGRAGLPKGVPTKFPTSVYRNYTIIKDGLINVACLPLKLSKTTKQYVDRLVRDGEVQQGTFSFGSDGVDMVFLDKLPIINRKMVKEASAKTLFEKQYEVTVARAAQKVYNTYKKDLAPRKSDGFEAVYGKDAATWLKEQGITDYSGFNPKSVQAPSTDVYMGKELTVSLKGLSSLPSLKDAKAGKGGAGAVLMKPFVDEVEKFLASGTTPDRSVPPNTDEWLETKQKEATQKVRGLLYEIAQIKFSIIVGQIWFTEFKSLDENSLTISVNGQKVDAKAELREVEIKI